MIQRTEIPSQKGEFEMTRITRLTIGTLLTGAALFPAAAAQAEAPSQPAVVADSGSAATGSAEGIMCTILRLVLMNQGPQDCQ